jgi:membrane protein involved in colicin uptake
MIEAPKMRYHEDTGLVFVQGTADQQELVRQVLQNLEKDQEMLRNANAMRAQLEAQKDHAAREASRIKAQEEARKEKEGKQGDR